MSSYRKKSKCYCYHCGLNPCECHSVCPPQQNIIPAYGSLYRQTPQTITVNGTKVDFEIPGPAANITLDTVNDEIIINEPGVYEITISLTIILLPGIGGSASLFVNDVPINFANALLANSDGQPRPIAATVSKTVQLDLVATDVLDVRVDELLPIEIQSVAFTVNKIN
ncbi:hypothetical protein [Priestia filamentosa]|uniref:BclA C-terminal domain-containing protein n=1 Tax=Priestia filamentosa TaxID=1402861 RepID=A0A0H4KJR6_9BACI|nr:hypothetical protein [Priestia filamentosa]AKO92549.1 hypothetical protein BEH_10890 [Priestia filamentosa]